MLLVTEEYGAIYGLVYSFVALFMTFALFNVIVAIFVENTLQAAKGNDVLKRRARGQDEHRWAATTSELIHTIIKIKKRSLCGDEKNAEEIENLSREAGNLAITKAFFKDLIEEDDFRERLRELDIANEDIPDLFDTFDADDSGTLTVLELLKGIKKLRGDPRRSDVIGVSLVVQSIHDMVQEQNEAIKVLGKRVQESESRLVAALPRPYS